MKAPAIFLGGIMFALGCGASETAAKRPAEPAGDKLPSAGGDASAQPSSQPSAMASAPSAPPSASGVASAAPIASAAPASACGATMALIPAGSYQPGGKGKDTAVGAFCIDRTETTFDQYQECVKAGKCTAPTLGSCEKSGPINYDGRGDHPIVCVDLAMASGYCAFRDKRLATDIEWEWAARGGEKAASYPWGEEAPDKQLCWSGGGTQLPHTCVAGSFPGGANPQGVLDLAGNVGEWVTSKNDTKIPDRGGRGGSWQDALRASVKANHSSWFKPEYRCGFLGIRCVKEAPTSGPH